MRQQMYNMNRNILMLYVSNLNTQWLILVYHRLVFVLIGFVENE